MNNINELKKKLKHFKADKLGKYYKIISSKTNDGRIFPPYLPFKGKYYEKYRLLLYAVAQNIPFNSRLSERYSKHYDKLDERLNYSNDFKVKYPDNPLSYKHIDIAPYQEGILPALAGIFIYIRFNKLFEDLDDVQDCIAVTNYYKFSIHNEKRDVNPNKRLKEPLDYWEINDQLVKDELDLLKPEYIISFKGRHNQQLKDYKTFNINDPSWIKRGGGGCLRTDGSWGRKAREVSNPEIIDLIDDYLKQINTKLGKIDSIKVYLLSYYLKWKSGE